MYGVFAQRRNGQVQVIMHCLTLEAARSRLKELRQQFQQENPQHKDWYKRWWVSRCS